MGNAYRQVIRQETATDTMRCSDHEWGHAQRTVGQGSVLLVHTPHQNLNPAHNEPVDWPVDKVAVG